MRPETLGQEMSLDNTTDATFMKYQSSSDDSDSAMNHASIAFWAFFEPFPI
jgi:hypothetical protein